MARPRKETQPITNVPEGPTIEQLMELDVADLIEIANADKIPVPDGDFDKLELVCKILKVPVPEPSLPNDVSKPMPPETPELFETFVCPNGLNWVFDWSKAGELEITLDRKIFIMRLEGIPDNLAPGELPLMIEKFKVTILAGYICRVGTYDIRLIEGVLAVNNTAVQDSTQQMPELPVTPPVALMDSIEKLQAFIEKTIEDSKAPTAPDDSAKAQAEEIAKSIKVEENDDCEYLIEGEKIEHDFRVVGYLMMTAWGGRRGFGMVNLHKSLPDVDGFAYGCEPYGDRDGRQIEIRVYRTGHITNFVQDRNRRILDQLLPLRRQLEAHKIDLEGLEDGVAALNEMLEAKADQKDIEAARTSVLNHETHIPRLKALVDSDTAEIARLEAEQVENLKRDSPYLWVRVFDLDEV